MFLRKIKSVASLAAVWLALFAFGAGTPTATYADGAEPAATAKTAAPVVLAQVQDEEDVNDPLEPMNRFIFEFNEVLQDIILRPAARFYNETVPPTVRLGVSNFLHNLRTPIILANDILQGEFDRALQTFGRFFVNTTIGIAGMADVAGELGVERHDEDFGQTLAVYGVEEGFYLVLPIIGPSNPRDAIGRLGADTYLNPLGLWLDNTDRDEFLWTLVGARGLDQYAGIVDELDQVKKTSVDYYAAVRSLYRQKRKTEIRNGSILELPPIPDLGYDMIPEDFDQSLAGVQSPPSN